MKPISKKIIEAGLVSKHTLLLMQRWGYMDPEANEQYVKAAELTKAELGEGLTRFVEDLDTLLEEEKDQDMKETRLSITLRNPYRIQWMSEKYGNWSTYGDPIVVFRDEADRLIFPPSTQPHEGMTFKELSSGDTYEITASVPLWHGDIVYAYQVETE